MVTGLGLNEQGTRRRHRHPARQRDAGLRALRQSARPHRSASARSGGHEILLEVPLEPFDYPENDPGPDTLLTGQAPRDNLEQALHRDGQVRRLCRR